MQFILLALITSSSIVPTHRPTGHVPILHILHIHILLLPFPSPPLSLSLHTQNARLQRTLACHLQHAKTFILPHLVLLLSCKNYTISYTNENRPAQHPIGVRKSIQHPRTTAQNRYKHILAWVRSAQEGEEEQDWLFQCRG